MAQLVARFHGMEEVRGSNPLSSTHTMSAPSVLEGADVRFHSDEEGADSVCDQAQRFGEELATESP